jgi:nucleoside-diphosphate-sugar epimerase
MSTILVTGASGFIGSAVSAALNDTHRVIGMSRHAVEVPNVIYVPGEFGSFEDLRRIDGYDIDVVVHLAAIGGAVERECLKVNFEGTRCLMRYLIDRGCKKFVAASTIAAVGMESVDFRPDQLPIPDDHTCYDLNGYGFSKFLMEELTKYLWRQHPDIDVINLRLSSVIPEDPSRDRPTGIPPIAKWTVGHLTVMLLPDAVRAFTLAALSPHRPGVRIMNAAAARAWATVPTADILQSWWGDEVDLSYYRRAGNESHSVFAVNRIRSELGFSAERTLQFLTTA